MAGQSNHQPSTGTPRTNREFAEQLTAWDFAQRKVDGVHLVFRGPHGGTLRVIRSLAGRADTPVVEKAARLAGVTVDRFWAGPVGSLPEPQQSGRTVSATSSTNAARPSRASVTELFDQLFPSGVRMTADLLADYERWAELTEKLAEHARAS
jgi:hypothetical protein